MVADYAGRFGCLSSSVMHATNYVLRIEADKLRCIAQGSDS